MNTTTIEWATHSASYQAGCTKVSPACTNCYAIPQSARLERMGQDRYAGVAVHRAGSPPRWTGQVTVDYAALRGIFRDLAAAKRPRRLFLNSMTDTFHAGTGPVRVDGVGANLALARLAQELENPALAPHVVMLLTKRADRARAFQQVFFPQGLPPWVWLGVTVEDQLRADERLPDLVQTRAKGVLFVSMEPLLGPVDLTCVACPTADAPQHRIDVLRRGYWCKFGWLGLGPAAQLGEPRGGFTNHSDLPGRVSWVITGGESGPNARPTHPAWVKALRDQCAACDSHPAFFHKQWGEWGSASQLDLNGEAFERRVYGETTVARRARGADLDAVRRPRVDELVLGADGEHVSLLHPNAFAAARAPMTAWRVGKRITGRHVDGVLHHAIPGVPDGPA